MDLTEAFAAPGGGNGGGDDLVKTDFFDFVITPPSQSDGISDEENFLHRDSCRGIAFLHSDHDRRDSSTGFIKETNNNTLTALPPVSTITGSLSHHNRNNHIQGAEHISMETADCDYWSTADSKEHSCHILLEDLNKYCWQAQAEHGQEANDNASVSRTADDRLLGSSDRQNTDGAIYTLTVLNNEANSMDALDCCKSPPAPSNDWGLRPNLDIEAILNMETAEHERVVQDGSTDAYHTIPISAGRFAPEDVGFADSKDICVTARRRSIGDNNNDWKLSDRNRLQDGGVQDSAESLLRNALQGKIYTGPVVVVTSSPSASSPSSSTATLQKMCTSTSSTTTTTAQCNTLNSDATSNTVSNSQPTATLQIITDQRTQSDEHMQTCTEEDLLLSQLDATTYRPADYEKLKCIANEVVESYCSLEPVAGTGTTVMYTLDPTSGSLGTITLAAELAPVGTVTVVATPEALQVAQQQSTQDAQNRQTSGNGTRAQQPGTGRNKSGKKYVRRKGNGTNAAANGNNSTTGNAATLQQQSAGSPSANATSTGGTTGANAPSTSGATVAPKKERSLHYCHICHKGFKDKYSVNVHIRTHTGEKPFSCSMCGKSFRQKAHLAKHYQTHVAPKPVSGAASANITTNASVTVAAGNATDNNSNPSNCS